LDCAALSYKWIKTHIPAQQNRPRVLTPPLEKYSSDYGLAALGIGGLVTNTDKIDSSIDYVFLGAIE
jgi:hypothetical protein